MNHYENKLRNILKNDHFIMSVLEAVDQLNLNDGWVAAGFIRNKVWDHLHHQATPINDIDVIYFDKHDLSLEKEAVLEEKLKSFMPNQPWSVKNQARMHLKNDFDPFQSSYEGVAHFPETPTAIAVKRCKNDLNIMAPYGLEDLFEKRVKPTPYFSKNKPLHMVYRKRMMDKNWNSVWRHLTIDY